MTKTTQEVQGNITIPAIQIQTFGLNIVGDTPLISHAWGDKAQREMLEKHMKKATKGKESRNPLSEFMSSLYWLTDKPDEPTMDDVTTAKFGFPVVGFKAAGLEVG